MPLSNHAGSKQAPSNNAYSSNAGQHTVSDARQTGRKSSLATSLQNFANRTFQSIPRRTPAGYERVDEPATPSLRHASTKLPVSISPSKPPIHRSRPATSTTFRVPPPRASIPPVPPLPTGSGSRIPTLSRIPGPCGPEREQERKYEPDGSHSYSGVKVRSISRYMPCPPAPKPFVEYQDVKSLSALNINKTRQKQEDVGREQEEGKFANSTRFQKPTMPFGRRRSPSFSTSQRTRKSSGAFPKSVSMATLASSRRTSAIPPVPSLQSLHALTENRVRAAITRGVNAVTGTGNRQTPNRTTTQTPRAVNTASRATTKCDPKDRDLPLPPIPAFPKSYSIGNMRIDSSLDKTPGSSRKQRKRGATVSHAHGTLKPTQTGARGSPRGAVLNCYVTAPRPTQIQKITEPLIDLTPPRQSYPADSGSPVSASTLISSDGYEQLEDNVQLVTECQPEQYWLGRFSTLINSLQYEEAFNETDPLIGYRTPARTKFLRSCGIEGIEEFNVKRVFTALERVCKTAEAKRSLHDFKDAYESRFTRSGTPKPFKGAAKAKDFEVQHTAAQADVKAEAKRKAKENNDTGNAGESGVRYLIRSVRKSLV